MNKKALLRRTALGSFWQLRVTVNKIKISRAYRLRDGALVMVSHRPKAHSFRSFKTFFFQLAESLLLPALGGFNSSFGCIFHLVFCDRLLFGSLLRFHSQPFIPQHTHSVTDHTPTHHLPILSFFSPLSIISPNPQVCLP